VEGTVTEENSGGVVVMVKGVRVFVPASLTGVPRGTPLTTILRNKVRLVITEADTRRKRVVGSIRAAERVDRRERVTALWAEIEPGKKYTGTVRSLTSFGAFVDIGGADGLVHVSEISWKRIRKPEDVLTVGDEIEVTVISVDREKKKISLRYRRDEDDPWLHFRRNFAVGDIINAKVVRLMAFGAFAEIIPDIDGLIHISQIADHRIESPKQELSVGQHVDVKITEIDDERRRISLSIRALLDDGQGQPRGGYDDEPDYGESDYGAGPVVVYDTESAANPGAGDNPGEDYPEAAAEESSEEFRDV
jgi:4-hydroxy-3-methylbut-2-enyl diphosphate reductase